MTIQIPDGILPYKPTKSEISHSTDGTVVLHLDKADGPIEIIQIHLCDPMFPHARYKAEMLPRVEVAPEGGYMNVSLDRRIPVTSTIILDKDTGLPWKYKTVLRLPLSEWTKECKPQPDTHPVWAESDEETSTTTAAAAAATTTTDGESADPTSAVEDTDFAPAPGKPVVNAYDILSLDSGPSVVAARLEKVEDEEIPATTTIKDIVYIVIGVVTLISWILLAMLLMPEPFSGYALRLLYK